MKRILTGILSLAIAAGCLFAQEEKKEGLKLSSGMITGLRFTSDQYLERGKTDIDPDPFKEEWIYTPTLNNGNAKNRDHVMEVWHDDDTVLLFQLDGSYIRENYGLVFRLRFQPWEMLYGQNPTMWGVYDVLHQAYGWMDFLDKKIRFSVGRFDDEIWQTAGDETFSYGNSSLGARIEIKPIDGLSFGAFFNPGKDPQKSPLFLGTGGDFNPAHVGYTSRQVDNFFKETGLGAKFTHDIIDIAAGLRLDSEWDGTDTMGYHENTTLEAPTDDWDEGMAFYFGLNVKAVKNLRAAAEVEFYNLGGFNKYGYVWLNEVIYYDLSDAASIPLTVGATMHQYFFGADNNFVDYRDDNGTVDYHSVLPILRFIPGATYKVSDRLSVGAEIPFAIWPEVSFDVGFKPKVTFNLGYQAFIVAYYLLEYRQYNNDYTTRGGWDGNSWRNTDGMFKNAVQINVGWQFL